MMKKPVSVMLAVLCALIPSQAIAQTVLDEMSAQIKNNSVAPEESDTTITLDDLRAEQTTAELTDAESLDTSPAVESVSSQIAPPDYSVPSSTGTRPDVVGTVSDGVNSTFDTNRFIDPITGRIDGAITGITDRFNSALDRVLSGVLSPIDDAIDGAFDEVDGAIDKAIASVLSPVDQAISNVMASIDSYIDDLLGDVFGGIFGGGSRNDVEAAFNPTSPLPSIVTATSFQTGLSGITAPYTDTIPFETGSMGLPDYSKIMPTLDLLAVGEDGHPNAALQGADRFSTTPETLKMSLSGEIERLGSRSIAQAALSKTGQADMKAALDGAEETLETIIGLGDGSQDMDVTQDVMKNLSAQLANDSVLRAGQYNQDILTRQQAAADAVVNAEIAQLLSEQNRASRANRAGSAAGLHVSVGQLHLPGEKADE